MYENFCFHFLKGKSDKNTLYLYSLSSLESPNSFYTLGSKTRATGKQSVQGQKIKYL